MGCPLFERIWHAVEAHDDYFVQKRNAASILGLSSLQKITAAFRMLTYGVAAGPLGRFAAAGHHMRLAATGQMRRLAADGHDAPLSAPAAMLSCGMPERRWSPCFLHVAAAGPPVQPVPPARELQARGNTPAKESPAREIGLGRIGVGFGCRRFASGVRPFSRRQFFRLPFALCWTGDFLFSTRNRLLGSRFGLFWSCSKNVSTHSRLLKTSPNKQAISLTYGSHCQSVSGTFFSYSFPSSVSHHGSARLLGPRHAASPLRRATSTPLRATTCYILNYLNVHKTPIANLFGYVLKDYR
jgi:hypothetical protein